MDFDHVTAAKRGNISDLTHIPPAEFLAELTRCELVCSNCHRLRTAYRRAEAHLDAAESYDLALEL